jgi:hypothetical protein
MSPRFHSSAAILVIGAGLIIWGGPILLAVIAVGKMNWGRTGVICGLILTMARVCVSRLNRGPVRRRERPELPIESWLVPP